MTLTSSVSLHCSLLHQVPSSPRAEEAPPETQTRTPTRTTCVSPTCNPLFSPIASQLQVTSHLSPIAPPFSPVAPHLSPAAAQFSPVSRKSPLVVQPGNSQQVQSTTEQCAVHATPRPLPLYGMKVVGDNIDWTIHPRFVRIDQQTQSIHYFNCYALKDRIDLSSLSDVPPMPTTQPSMSEVISKVFPSAHEESVMHDDFAILLARMLCSHMTYFKETFADVIDWHISHRYSAEMSTKSDVVSCCN